MTAPITHFRDEHHFLSNFYPAPIEYEGMMYDTVEHAYQAAKSDDDAVRRKVQVAASPAAAKSMGKRIPRRENWFAVNLGILEALVRQKFTHYPELGAKLVATGDTELIEGNTWNDKFFGMVQDKKTGAWKGENHLGKILMRVREELRETAGNEASTTTGDTLRDHIAATLGFYQRFGWQPHVPDAIKVFQEEVNELIEAAQLGTDKRHIAEEAADVITTVIGICFASGVEGDLLIEQVRAVIAKNNAKTHDTHENKDGKIRRKSV
jgi:N-glycosidase YbiA